MDTVQNGKGSKRRPTQISEDELAERWALAFRKKQPEKRVLILASTHRHAEGYAEEHGLGDNWICPGNEANYLRGLRNVEIVKLEGWEQGKSAEFMLVLNALESQLAGVNK